MASSKKQSELGETLKGEQNQSDKNNTTTAGGPSLPSALDAMTLDIDALLDAIPEDRKGRKYTEGWDPTRLEEELKQHPFFIKEAPKEGEPVPPLIEALQAIKYSPDDNTPDELAKNYKEDGLFHFKLKKYRIAVLCFTEAIRSAESPNNPIPNGELTAQLYNNRAAAHFHIQNYRSALSDCEKAMRLKDDYFKPVFKAVECCAKLGKWKRVMHFCDIGEKIQPDNADIRRMRLLAIRKKKLDNAAERKNSAEKQAHIKMNEKIISYIESRNIVCRNKNFLNADSELGNKTVTIGEDDRLTWPVLFHYPQYSQSDFIEAFHEDSSFTDHLFEIFENERPAWDKENEYRANTVDVNFVNFHTGGHTKIDVDWTIGQVLQHKEFVLPANGVPSFFIMAKNNKMCQALLDRLHQAGT